MTRLTRTLCGGIHFGEGPRWHDGRLWFSDFFAHAVKSVSLKGDLRTEFTIDDRPSGLGWMPNGDMLIVSMEKRKLLRRTPAGQTSVHADLNAIATWHCNDMVVDSAGRAYVGNFGFDLDTELTKRGAESVIADHTVAKLALVQPDGTLSVAATDMHFPNGSVITPDGKTLIVGESLGGCLTAFDIGAKRDAYHRAGVAWYWLVDPANRTLTVLRHGVDGYVMVLAGGVGERLRVGPFEAVEIDLSEIFDFDDEPAAESE